MVLGTLLQGIGMLWLALSATQTVDYIALVPALVIAGVRISMALPTTSTAVLNAMPLSEMGRASGVNNTLRSHPSRPHRLSSSRWTESAQSSSSSSLTRRTDYVHNSEQCQS